MRPAPPSELGDRGVGRWIVAYSGGVDSTVLLHALRQARPNESMTALHVHHGLHQEADAWAAHCQRFCDDLGVTLTVVRASVARDGGEGLEAAARRARYSAFETETNAQGDVLVTAHHIDDQAETFLLRALRASGADALGAMRAWRRLGQHWLWRPLLDVSRADL
ncbi:MAG: tRNA lysidine(34) synthetase TilS, partial [Luteimonas sp.]